MARRAGVSNDVLWTLCHRELFREVLLWLERKVEAHNDAMRLAWRIADLVHAKKLPPIQKLLIGESSKPPKQSHQEQLAVIQQLSELYGGEVRRLHG